MNVTVERCRERPSPALVEAVRLFNAGRYDDCARALGPLWNGEREPIRYLYRGLAQAAAGLLHLRRQNRHGSTVKLASALHHLRPFEPHCLGIDVARLVADLEAVEVGRLDTGLPQVSWVREGS